MFPLSDSSILIKLGDAIDPLINQRVHALAAQLNLNPLEGVTETVPGYASLVIHYDPLVRSQAEITDWLSAQLDSNAESALRPPRRIEIPVIYSGPDLAFVAKHCHLKVGDVIRIHSETEYTVYMMGFMPGFPYLGKLPESLVTPRLATPRSHVPAGSVAIAGAQTGIYPVNSPGGWQLIGQTSLPLHDARREPPFLLAPGDTVRFIPEQGGA
jgi:KipI family sensor histidine kinase inhibitor